MLSVRRVSGVWRVQTGRTGAVVADAAPALIAPLAAFPADEEAIWGLELTKTSRAASVEELARLRTFCQACVANPDIANVISVLDEKVAARALRVMLRPYGVVMSNTAADFMLALTMVTAAVAAALALILTGLRLLGEPRRRLTHDAALPVIHAEISTRTRHLVTALTAAKFSGDVLIVGRPTRSAKTFSAELQTLGLHANVVRPLDLRALAVALWAFPSIAFRCLKASMRHPSAPRLRELTAALYRMALGRAHMDWWRRSRTQPATIVYAHTGIADTSLLECEQQRTGATTIHWAHGVSAGLNFVAYSNLGLFQTEHDAQWHRQLGGYRWTWAQVARRPPYAGSGDDWLVLSNLVHPMNPVYASKGPVSELTLVDWVLRAANAARPAPKQIIWRMHPVFDKEPVQTRRAVQQKLAANGIRLWRRDAPADGLENIGLVISTPSTAAIDLLKAGKPVMVAAVEPLQNGVVYERFAAVARTAVELGELSTVAGSEAAFSATWHRIGPSAELAWSDVLAIAGDDRRGQGVTNS